MIGVNESNLDSCNREGDICIFDEEKQVNFHFIVFYLYVFIYFISLF